MELRKNSGPLKWTLIVISVLFLAVMLLLPLIYILATALRQGFAAYANAVTDTYALKAAALTLQATLWAVGVNTVFGLCAAWCLTKFAFRGKKIISTRYYRGAGVYRHPLCCAERSAGSGKDRYSI